MDGVRADLRLDALGAQGLERLVAAIERDDVCLPAMAVAVVGRRRADEMLEPLSIPVGDALARGEERLAPLELRKPEGAEDVRQAVVEAWRLDVRRMPCGDPMVPQATHRGGELGLVRRHGAALARRHDLPRMEREAGQQPERAARGPAIARPERPRGVLDQDDVLRHGGLELLPGNGAPEEVDGQDGPGPRGYRVGHELRTDEERLRIDVDEHRARTAELD